MSSRDSEKPDFSKFNNQKIQEDAQQLLAASSKKDIASQTASRTADASTANQIRDRIVRSYDSKSATRARNARIENIDAMNAFKAKEEQRLQRARMKRDLVFDEPHRPNREYGYANRDRTQLRKRTNAPATADRMHDEAMETRERYERERMRRDALLHRSGDRELIDGRGSIDSRALNERNELVGYTVDAQDRHEPDIDSIESGTKWSSRDGRDIRSMSDSITSRSDLNGIRRGFMSLPFSMRALIVLIAVLLVVLIVLIFF